MIKKIKILSIEYAVWLYVIACISWFLLRLGNISFSGWIILLFPLLIAFLFTFSKNCIGAKIIISEQPGALWKVEFAIVIIITLIMAWVIVEVKPIAFFTQAANTKAIVSGIFNPNLKELVPMLSALVETIYLALLATIFAIPFAFVLSFFAAKNLMNNSFIGRIAYIIIRTVSTVVRSIEAIVWAIIFCVWVGIGPFAGMLALWIHSIAALVKLYSEQIENIDPGPVEAIKATGASTLQVWRMESLPRFWLLLGFYYLPLGYEHSDGYRSWFCSGGGIGLALYQQQQMLAWRNVGLIMWLIALVVWVMDMFSGYIRSKLVTY